jgi:hypothetical protein
MISLTASAEADVQRNSMCIRNGRILLTNSTGHNLCGKIC